MIRFAIMGLAGGVALAAAPVRADPPMPIAHEAAATGGSSRTPRQLGALHGEALIERDCSGCHALSMATGAKHTTEEWSNIIDRMAG